MNSDSGPWALAAARRGWHVFPLRIGGKQPSVRDWENWATADLDRLRLLIDSGRWHPLCNYGIAPGPSGLVVADLDAHKPPPDEWQQAGAHNGIGELALIAQWAGHEIPATFTVRTASGGVHLYFREPAGTQFRNTAGQLAPDIDTRGHGGYVVGPGSQIGGQAYTVTDSREPAELPAWMARLLTPPPPLPRAERASCGGSPDRRLAALLRTVEAAPEGQLNNTLHWAACRVAEMVSAGQADESAAAADLLAAAVSAGHPESAAARTIASGLRKAGAR
jgi:hypothetical protein